MPVSNTILAATGQTFAASNLFSAADVDMDLPVQYDFWDNGAGGEHWVTNGAPGLTNTDNPVNAANLSQVTYQAGSGTDTLGCAQAMVCNLAPGRIPSPRREEPRWV